MGSPRTVLMGTTAAVSQGMPGRNFAGVSVADTLNTQNVEGSARLSLCRRLAAGRRISGWAGCLHAPFLLPSLFYSRLSVDHPPRGAARVA